MIVIVNYERATARRLSEFLSERGIANKVTLDEMEISKADKIILPHFNDLKSVLRKLQLSNVFNLLKVIKKDILGINAGMILFCQYVREADLTGLGVLENVEVCGRTECSFEAKLEIVRNEALLDDCENDSFHFSFDYYLTETENTIAKIDFENKSISAALKKKNFYAVLFSIERSGESGEKVIRNFMKKI